MKELEKMGLILLSKIKNFSKTMLNLCAINSSNSELMHMIEVFFSIFDLDIKLMNKIVDL